MISLTELLEKQCKKYGDKPLLITDNNTYSYRAFYNLVSAYAFALEKKGAKHGSKIALVIETFDDFYASLFAVWSLGAVAVPLNVSLEIKTLQNLIDRSGSEILLFGAEKHRALSADTIIDINDVSKDATSSFTPSHLSAEETAVIMFTSGTTGIPKGVIQTMFAQSENARMTCEKLALGESDRIFINTPPYFTSGLCHFTTLLYAGGSLVGHMGFVFGKDLLTKMEETGSTGFGGAPAHLVRVVSTMTEVYDNDRINFWMSSGDHLPKDSIEKANQWMPHVKIVNVYGLTEMAGRFCILKPEFARAKHGSVGTPIGDLTVTVVDSDGHPAKPREIGEINANGALLFKGYLDMPDLTEKALGAYGFRTGDFGYLDEDGFLFVEGRKDDIFKRGGEKVSTNKIKQAMLELKQFKDVAVIAVDDMLMGKVPYAFVVMRDDVKFSRIQIIKALKKNIVDTHIPAKIIALDEIPRTGSGKAIMAELRKIAED